MERCMDGVLILLSAYNGEKYIEQQLASIAGQTYGNIFCLIRDDGSKDSTYEIITEFCRNHRNFRCFKGENIGVVGSFNELMKQQEIDSYKYIAFSDQDDIWLPQKVQRAVEKLEAVKDGEKYPLMYCSNLQAVDGDLQPRSYVFKKYPKNNKYTPVITSIAYGCTEVFNQKAKELYIKGIDCRIKYHDYWVYMICMYMGRVIYDQNGYILYRQHGNNVLGFNKRSIAQGIGSINQVPKNAGVHQHECFEDFLNLFDDGLSDADKEIIKTYLGRQSLLSCRLKLVFDPRYKSYSARMTLGFKVRALLKKI